MVWCLTCGVMGMQLQNLRRKQLPKARKTTTTAQTFSFNQLKFPRGEHLPNKATKSLPVSKNSWVSEEMTSGARVP